MRKILRLKKKRSSMRSVVILTVGTALLFFMTLFSYIFVDNMFDLLEKSEADQIRARGEIVTSAVNASVLATRAFATDWASWDETYDFARGQNPDHFQKYWTEDWKIQGQKYNFLVVKDLAGNDLYVKYYDYFAEQNIPVPEGFSQFLTGLADDMQKKFQERRDYGIVRPEDRDGFVFYNGVAYYVCARPILTFNEKSYPAGSLFFGRILNGQEIERITNAKNLSFTVLEGSDTEIQNLVSEFDSGILPVKTAKETIALYTRLPGFLETSNIVLKMERPRYLYQSGLKIIKASCVALGIVMLCFIAVLFYSLEKHILRPIERISGDVQKVADSSEIVDTDAYDNNRELSTLAWAINSMLERLSLNQEIAMQSTVSLNILQNILNALDTYLFVVDMETEAVLFINDKMKNHFHLEGDIIGRPCYEVIKPGIEKNCEFCARPRLLERPDEPVVKEVKINITDRYYRKVDMVIDWVDGKKVHLLYFIDITELKQAEAAIEKRLEQEKLLSAISRSFITKGDMKAFMNNTLEMTGKFMNISRILLAKHDEKDLGMELKYAWAAGKNTVCVKPGGKLPIKKYKSLYEELVKNNYEPIIFNGTEENRFKNEKSIGFKAFLAVPLYVAGKFWGILEFDKCEQIYNWSESDIFLGKLIGNVLSSALTNQSAEERLLHMSALIDSAPQYISYINLRGEYEFFNPATCEITGYSYDELMAGGVSILYDDQTKQKIAEEIIPKIGEFGKYEFELPLVRKNGEVRMMSFSAFAIESDNEKHGCIAVDVTEKKRLEKNLTEAKETAEKASHAKGEFLSRMSHEMRTPMNAIIGMTNIAKNSPDIEKKEYCLDKIANASKHLLGVINDILDMSKIEANKFELSYSEFDLEKMLINATSMINFRVEEKRQSLIVSLDENIPRFIIGDEQRLSQVVTNLLSNAVKFTPETGTIRLNVKNSGVENGSYNLQFAVEDNGIGISPEQQSRLFKSFEQADGGIARQYGGTGLGLAISKRIVEMMEGRIWVESQLGQGTKFTFMIKVRKGDFQAKPLFTFGINKDNLRILAVDDSFETREYFLNIMQRFGLSCDVASDGFEALKIIAESKDRPYNMFFIDWLMPQMNGIELTRKIRRITNDNAIVFMISIAEWKEIEIEAREAGVNRFISKPLFPSILFDSINECLGKDKTAEKSFTLAGTGAIGGTGIFAGIDATNDFGSHTLLLAEDVDINREIVAAFLEDTKLTIDFAENGAKALELFKKHPEKYSLILMDVHMPEMDGYEATRNIRALDFEKAKNIPIVAMTANVFREDVENCLAAGMNDHIGKPVDTDQLFGKLKKYLPYEKKSKFEEVVDGADSKQIESEGNSKTIPPGTEYSGYARFLPVLDVKDGLGRVINNKKLYFMLLKNFKAREMTDELIQNITEDDFDKTKQTAHALKGAALNLGLVQLADIAKDIELQAKLKIKAEHLLVPLGEAVDAAVLSIDTLLESEEVK